MSTSSWTRAISTDQSATAALSSLLAICIAFMILVSLFLLARFYTAIFLRKSKSARALWWDDWLVIPPYITYAGMVAVTLKMRSVFIHSIPTVTGHQLVNPEVNIELYPTFRTLLKCIYVYTMFMFPVYCSTRLSIIALYLRVFNGRRVRFFSYLCGVIMILHWLVAQFVAIFPCQPIHQYWDRVPGAGHCINSDTFFRANSYPMLVQDFFLIIVPLPTIWSLKISRLRKAAVSALFLTSILALIASAYRTKIVQTRSSTYLTPSQTNVWLSWMIVETGMYIIVACLPTLAPLFQAWLPSSLQRASRRQVDQMRSRCSRMHSDDAVRLVDSNTVGSTRVDVAHAAPSAKSEARTLPAAELKERATTPNGGLRLDDLRGMQAGSGVLVHTEIIVTQEDKIANVLGI